MPPIPDRAPLLEREQELALAAERLDALCAAPAGGGRAPGSVLVFEGPAGLGKTSLLGTIQSLATEHGCTVLAACGGEREQTRAFHVVRQLFRPLLAARTDAERTALLGGWLGLVAPTVGLAPADSASVPPDPQGVRDALDWLMASLTSREGPVVMLVDDAHWADRESLVWLEAFAQGIAQLPVLAVVARRPEEPTPNAALLADIATGRSARRNDLAPLSECAVADLVRRRLGTGGAPEFTRRCRQVAEGNPYVVGEVLKEAHGRGIRPVATEAGQLDAIADAVVGRGMFARLVRLGPHAVGLARALAVLGADARLDRAAALGGLTPDETTKLADDLRAARILAMRGGLDFEHPLVATEVYLRTPPSTRSALHAHAAQLIVRDSGGDDPGTVAAAAHLLAVEPAGDWWVVDQLRSAARADMLAGAPHTAARYLERALEEPPPPELRAVLRYELGLTALQHDPGAGVVQLKLALEACSPHDKGLRDAILMRLAKSLAHNDQMAEAVGMLETEARHAKVSRARLRLQAEHFLWGAFWVDDDDAYGRARRLRSLASRLSGEDTTERLLLGLRAWYGAQRGDPAVQVLAYAESASSPPLSWVDDDWTFEIPVLIAMSFLYCDRPQPAERLYEAGIVELEERGWRGSHLAIAHTLMGHVRYRTGRLLEAEKSARFGLELAERLSPHAPARCYALATLIQVLVARGSVEEAVQLADKHAFGEPFPNAVVFPEPQVVRGELLLAQGLDAEAAVQLLRAGESLERRGASNPAWCPWRPYLALAVRGTDAAQAKRLARRAVGQAHVFGAPSAIGQSLRVSGMVTGGAEGLTMLEESRQWLEHSPSRYEYALTLVEFGAALRRARRVKQARLRLAQGLDVATRCGAQALAERARGELLAAGGRPRRLYRSGPEALTARERQTAELAAAGMSNPQIAKELGIQLGTVNKHLTEVYAKLGIAGRSSLADALD